MSNSIWHRCIHKRTTILPLNFHLDGTFVFSFCQSFLFICPFLSNLCCVVSVSESVQSRISTTHSFLSLLGCYMPSHHRMFVAAGRATKRCGRMKYITANQRSKYQVYIMCYWFLYSSYVYPPNLRARARLCRNSTTTRSCMVLRTHTIYLCVKCWTRNIIIASHHIDEAPNTISTTQRCRVVCACARAHCVCTLMVGVCRRRCCYRCRRCLQWMKSDDKWQKRRLDSTHARAWLRFNTYTHRIMRASQRVSEFSGCRMKYFRCIWFLNKIAAQNRSCALIRFG